MYAGVARAVRMIEKDTFAWNNEIVPHEGARVSAIMAMGAS